MQGAGMPAPQRFLDCYFPGKVQPPSGCGPVMPGPYGRAAVLMGGKPCLAGAYLGRQGDAVMHNVFHFFFQDALYLIALCLGRLMMSAAVPWIGVLRAIRSPLART